jgi:hypothetical protein
MYLTGTLYGGIDSTYLYIDVDSIGVPLKEKERMENQGYSLDLSQIVIGLGRNDEKLFYCSNDGISFEVYYLGLNKKDEIGRGDDVIIYSNFK